MSRWFRWYEGTSEDGKFRVVARLSRVTVRDVIALWAFMLEDAAHLDHRGVCRRNEDFMASVLDFEDGTVERILSEMESAGMISVGHGSITICHWNKRQFEGDTDPTAAQRQARKRERDKTVSHARVTRDSRPPETEADTDTDTDSEPKGSAADAAPEPVGEDAKTKLFRVGKTALVSFGVAEKRTGALIGQWLKARNDPIGLLAAIQYARDQSVADPVAYVSSLVHSKDSSNGRHPGKTPQNGGDLARQLAAEVREREREAGLFGPADVVGSH